MHSAHATVPGIDHRRVHVNGTELHYALAGTEGTPVVLVHGFPESWWVFHKVMARLAEHHRVVAVDLRELPVLAVGGGSGEFTASAMRQVATDVTSVILDGIGHYVAMEARDRLADELHAFHRTVEDRIV